MSEVGGTMDNMTMRRPLITRLRQRLKRELRRRLLSPGEDPVIGGGAVRDIWSISVFRGKSVFALEAPWLAPDPVLTARDVADTDAIYVADPFLLRKDGAWHLFFEILERTSNRGVIGCATSVDLRRWRYGQVVLREPVHLSYPCVFEYDGEIYMVPETFQAHEVRLYRARRFPDDWEQVAVLLAGDEFVDASPFEYAGRWWMFVGGGRPPDRADTLRLFSAPRLEGPWEEHPASPLITDDPVRARPAGRVAVVDGAPVRFAQETGPYYGMSVRAFRVEALTRTEYREVACLDGWPVLAGSLEGWNAVGMHHVDPVALGPRRWIAAVDGWRWAPDRI